MSLIIPQKFLVKVQGLTPYMQHRMDDQKLEDWEKSRGQIIENVGVNWADEKHAYYHSYLDSKGSFYIPKEHFKQCFLNGGKMVKGKMGTATRSMKQVVAGQWFIAEEQIPIPKFDDIDKRSAVNQNVKARVMVRRPKWTTWKCQFTLIVENETLTLQTIQDIIDCGGSYIGVGSYRPEHSGEFGRFLAELTPLVKSAKPKKS